MLNSVKVRRLIVIMVLAMIFGIIISVFKGNGDGMRMAIGNAAAPWLILPLVSVLLIREHRIIPAALIGLLTSLVALSGFYLANTFVLDLGPHPWIIDLKLTMSAGRLYFILAFLSGSIFGALGGWQQKTHSNIIVILMMSLFIFEPIVGFSVPRFTNINSFTYYVDYPVVWAVEALVGLVLSIVMVIWFRKRK
jgi:hypothetical protein